MYQATKLCVLILLISGPILPAQESVGWDLSYTCLFKSNKVGQNEFLVRWLKKTDRDFTLRLLRRWEGERITASVLIEQPAFHAGEHSIYWLFRTEQKAFIWMAVNRAERQTTKKEIDPKAFDQAIKSISSWKQAKPAPPDSAATDEQRKALSGYIGFLNFSDGKVSRQMLLTVGDFINGGRLTKLLRSIGAVTE